MKLVKELAEAVSQVVFVVFAVTGVICFWKHAWAGAVCMLVFVVFHLLKKWFLMLITSGILICSAVYALMTGAWLPETIVMIVIAVSYLIYSVNVMMCGR